MAGIYKRQLNYKGKVPGGGYKMNAAAKYTSIMLQRPS